MTFFLDGKPTLAAFAFEFCDSLMIKAYSNKAPPIRTRQVSNHASIAVNTDVSNVLADDDILVKIR